MSIHSLGSGAETIDINMTLEMEDDIKARASSMQISTEKYIKIVLQQWIDSGNNLTMSA